MQPQSVLKATGDVTAYSTAIATLVGWLPSIAALLSVIWFSIQILEKATGKTCNELLRCVCAKISGAARVAWSKVRS